MPANAIARIAQDQSKGRHYNAWKLVVVLNSANRHRRETTYVSSTRQNISENSVFRQCWGTWASGRLGGGRLAASPPAKQSELREFAEH
jgi:hypothetical protein